MSPPESLFRDHDVSPRTKGLKETLFRSDILVHELKQLPLWGVQGEESIHAERCLGLFVLGKAVHDVQRGSPRMAEEARSWITGDSADLNWWCSLAGLSKKMVRERLLSEERVPNHLVVDGDATSPEEITSLQQFEESDK